MQDKKLREAFRKLVRYLNLQVMYDDFWGYNVSNNPPNSRCNIARQADIEDLQKQIDEIKAKQRVKKRR